MTDPLKHPLPDPRNFSEDEVRVWDQIYAQALVQFLTDTSDRYVHDFNWAKARGEAALAAHEAVATRRAFFNRKPLP